MMTATFAVAASIMYAEFQERAEQIGHVQDARHQTSAVQAAELLDVTILGCGATILHNYSEYGAAAEGFAVYAKGAGGVKEYGVSFRTLGGLPVDVVAGRSSVIIATEAPCGGQPVMVTPGGRQIALA